MPTSYYEKAVRSVSSHLWFVNLSSGKLIFTPKKKGVIDPEINDIFEHQLLEKTPSIPHFITRVSMGFCIWKSFGKV